jgi:ABC-type lipoprotein release transport system permease subunit
MLEVLRTVVTWILIAIGAVIGLALVLMLLLSVVLLVVLGLQAVGVLRRVPFSYNWRNLLVRWRTTLMTACAFVLVVGLMTVMLAFVNGMFNLTKGSAHPGNVIILQDGANDELFSRLDNTVTELPDKVRGALEDEDGNKLVSWETYIVVNQPIPQQCPVCGKRVELNDSTHKLEPHGDPPCPGSNVVIENVRKRRFVQLRGVKEPVIAGRVHGLELYPGGAWFDPKSGAQELSAEQGGGSAGQVVLGEGIARELGRDLGKDRLGPGDVFELGAHNQKWVVVGVMKSAGSTFDSEVWAKQSLAGKSFGKESYTTGFVRTADAESAKAFAEDAKTNFKTVAVQAQTETEYFDKLNATNNQFLIAIYFIVIVMAIGGVFGVMNTMFAAVSQRTKDVGVMRLLGYPRWQILTSFFLESLLLSLIGGLIGCALGSLCNGWSATSIMSSGPGGGKTVMLKLTVDWAILATGLGFSLAMGAVGGLIPALSAMRLRPLESLK